MSGEKYGSKTDVVVKLVLVFFIALLSFSIGTFVGKKFSDNQYKLAQLEPQGGHGGTSEETASATDAGSVENRGIASISPKAGEVKPEKALTDDEIAKLASEFVSDDDGGKKQDVKPTTAAADMNGAKKIEAKADGKSNVSGTESTASNTAAEAKAEAKAETPTNTKSVMAEAQPLKPAERMVRGKSAVVANPPVATSRIPSSLPKEAATSAIGKYTVQIASYASERDAQKKAAELKEHGYSAFYVAGKVKHQTWYRVSVGLFTTQKEANIYKKELIKNGRASSAIVAKVAAE
jgi:cell division protein FtsN